MPSSSKGEKIMTDLQRLKEKLIQLRLKTIAQHLETILKEASDKNRDSLFVLHQLADLEAEHRWHNAIKLRFQQSKLNEKLTIDQFDFNHHKSRKDQKTQILNLLNLHFVKILFTTAIDMINHLIAAEADRSLLKKLHYYQSPALLVCDELGYLSLGQQGSHLFFQVISARHQVKSTLLTTNLPFAEWGNVFDSTTVATAIADRLVHNSEVLIFGGESYRRKPKEKRSS
jgi:DNA replication protein DnaC